jgi:TPR repeat protein
MLVVGFGVHADAGEGLRFLRQAADGGDPQSLYTLGYALTNRLGTPRDPVQGLQYLRKSAEAGSRDGQLAYGRDLWALFSLVRESH